MMRTAFALFSLIVAQAASVSAAEPWQPAAGPLATRWAKDVSPERVHPEYPRPQMVREKWLNLNGLWEYAIRPKAEQCPESFEGRILVPFPAESALSGVMKQVGPERRLWYRRTFQLDGSFAGKRALLHFGAADWETSVWLNGKELGTHRGGYDPFSFDVSEALKADGDQELVASVWDPSDAGPQPRGKQVQKPGGIFYTPTTGIWQTVWLEPVPRTYVKSLRIVPDLDAGLVRVVVETSGTVNAPRVKLAVTGVSNGARTRKIENVQAAGEAGREIAVKLDQPMPWSPEAPWLYDLSISLADGDRVGSYFGMRKVSVEKDAQGVSRIFLNGKPQFMIGFLDQGFWPDGLYTAPTDEALRYDLEVTKKIGMNMCRKHVKVEPARWYHWCDKLGLLVWQDMPSGDASVAPGKGEITRSPESREIYERELKAMIDNLRNVPSIVMWVVFNEGWGQFDTTRITDRTQQYDPSRLVNCASGWNDYPAGDVIDVHNYPGPGSPTPSDKRAAVLGEYGGLGLPLEGHTWQAKSNWGYVKFADGDALAEAYVNLLTAMRPLQGEPGLSAAVYTQTTDVETEVNGLMTYDRKVLKIDEKRLARAHAKLFLPPPR